MWTTCSRKSLSCQDWNALGTILWIASSCYNWCSEKRHVRHWNHLWKFWTLQDKLGLRTCHLSLYLVLLNHCIVARAWFKLWEIRFFSFVLKYAFVSCKKCFACLLQYIRRVWLHGSFRALFSWNWQHSRWHQYARFFRCNWLKYQWKGNSSLKMNIQHYHTLSWTYSNFKNAV